MEKINDFSEFDSRDYFTVWEAACLLLDYKPSKGLDEKSSKDVIEKALELQNAISYNRIVLTKISGQDYLSRENLKNYVRKTFYEKMPYSDEPFDYGNGEICGLLHLAEDAKKDQKYLIVKTAAFDDEAVTFARYAGYLEIREQDNHTGIENIVIAFDEGKEAPVVETLNEYRVKVHLSEGLKNSYIALSKDGEKDIDIHAFSRCVQLPALPTFLLSPESRPVVSKLKKLNTGNQLDFSSIPDMKWSDVIITFMTDETIRVKVKKYEKVCHYAELGFADGRNKKTVAAWKILESFAKKGESIGWVDGIGTEHNVKSAIKELRNRLKIIFCLGDDPFYSYKTGVGWKTKFTVNCSSEFLNQ